MSNGLVYIEAKGVFLGDWSPVTHLYLTYSPIDTPISSFRVIRGGPEIDSLNESLGCPRRSNRYTSERV